MPREGLWLPPQYEIRLRVYASLAALAAILVMVVAFLVILVAFSWPSRDIGSPSARIYAGNVNDFEVGKPVTVPEGRFYLVKQEDGSFIALFWRSPHLGCTVAWREDLRFLDPRIDPRVTPETRGWFRDPCHGSTFDITGHRVYGPAPRDMDRFPVEIVGDSIYVLAVERHIIRGDPFGFWGSPEQGRVIRLPQD